MSDDGNCLLADRRGVSEALGFMIAISLLVALLAVLQVGVVPQWDAGVEADHAAQLQDDMVGFHGGVISVSTQGGETTAPITLGTRYPSSGLLLRPPPRAGSLSTSSGTVAIDNVAAPTSPETDAFLEDGRSYETTQLSYDINYREYTGPETRYEHGSVIEQHDDAAIRRAGNVVDGRTIRLVTLSGSVDRNGVDRISQPIAAESVSTQRRTVTGRNGEDIQLTLSTAFDQGDWEDWLDDEPHASVADHDGDSVTLELDGSQQYQLRLARVHLGEDPPEQSAAYVAVRGDSQVSLDESAVVRVLDAFGNPVADAEVEVEQDGETTTRRSDSEGELRVRSSSATTITVTVPETDRSTEVVVGAGEVADSTPPTFEQATSPPLDTDRYRVTGGTRLLSQASVSYRITDDDAGLDRLRIRVLDADDEVVTATTHTFDGEVDAEGRWRTPWLSGDVESYRFELRAVDTAGTPETCELSVDGGSCD